ncbi:flagellar basal body L-ring protein FlgH [Octadecabacter sp. 1_MG-2023]|uniref:flagellar basal body L-ring protein FlgH n=1 Tax=unclassified Octadecabacter TaxID=196158 RepID=UPI001C084079|nr:MULTISPECIES: flagellar basal body L-ring protein FlgH [unclassified Octadecabacter]MBU2992383.1 flagellar basal body L-ring protein FlgH [Octadecabacter sp. B2R22]MDO6734860.1 flagellar basal body L-ring protein FlgH [Octadecabacter sp. 1_MG-2023]
MRKIALTLLAASMALTACGRLAEVGKEPDFTPPQASPEATAMMTYGIEPELAVSTTRAVTPSLWTGERGSLLGDRRAVQRGDILTVVIEIDDSASISNSTDRSRSGSESMSVPSLFGVPQRIDESLPDGATLSDAVDLTSSSSFGGDGSVRRNEQLELRVAATIVGVMPNGVLSIQGTQEVRVNFEMRELLVSGFVRPEDISRQNEITYDKLASARISYGGRGQISDVQQPRYGQQIADVILPF